MHAHAERVVGAVGGARQTEPPSKSRTSLTSSFSESVRTSASFVALDSAVAARASVIAGEEGGRVGVRGTLWQGPPCSNHVERRAAPPIDGGAHPKPSGGAHLLLLQVLTAS
jgi:hypothetical protein